MFTSVPEFQPVYHDLAKAFLVFSGSNYRAVVAFCRVLDARGLDIHIVARTQQDLIFRTRYRRNVVAIRALDRLDFADLDRCILEARLKTGVSEFILGPTSEFLNLFLLENSQFFASRGCTIPLVDLNLYRRVSNKHSFSRICQSKDVSIPREVFIEASPHFPFVAKPRYNITTGKRSLYPYLINGMEDLAFFRQSENTADYYFEEFVAGPSYYLLYYLSRDGEVTAWSQQNLVQQPDGKSIVLAQVAQIHHDSVSAKFVEILQDLGFWGLVMIEVIQRDGEYVFIELNPRFWGPFQLLINSGSLVIDRFINEQMNRQPSPSPSSVRLDASYMWLGGIAQSMASGRQLTWHIDPPRHRTFFITRHLHSDVYLRRDTARLFFHEMKEAVCTWLSSL